jgi:hypothetical protein
MKISKIVHVLSVISGLGAVVVAFAAVIAGAGNGAFGLSREHLLFCSGILFLSAIWFGVSAIHHVMLEKERKII